MSARNRSEADLAELEANLIEFEACDPDNTQKEADIDNRFHLIVTKSSANPILQITMEPIYTLLPRMRNYIYGNIDGEKSNTVVFHRDLVKAIAAKDEDKACSVMKEHLSRTSEIYENYMKINE
jgi:GntR family transcriptional repressor for pyruvate dehydrogenase complex